MHLVVVLLLLFVCFHANSCGHKPEERWTEMGGPDKNTSIVLFFKKDASPEQIKEFHDKILSKPSPYGENKGLDLPDGVAGDFRVLKNGYEGIGINFSTVASQEEKERLNRRIKESSIVYKVYENVIPNEIRDL